MPWDWRIAFDFILALLVVRILIGWVVNSRALARLAVVILALSLLATLINVLNLPLSKILVITVLVPAAALFLIAYSPELRRALNDTGLQMLFGRREPRSRQLIACLADTLHEMARIRRGCLLVLPHGDNVLPYVVGGEEYDAQVRKSLLLSIFHPGCPRHDGAAIIRNSRLIRVGAVLPLSQARAVKEEWGTRHLAALGLSEQCDADILVVSEERGTISLVRRGKVTELPVRSVDALQDRLSRLLDDVGWTREPTNRLLKPSVCWIIAVVIALGATPFSYFLLRQQAPAVLGPVADLPTSQMSVTIPILFEDVPNGLYLEEVDFSACTVHLRFPGYVVFQQPEDLNLSVRLTGFDAGPHTVQLTVRMLSGLPEGWEVVRYEPSEINIRLGEAQIGSLPVQARLGEPPTGWRVMSVGVDPAEIRVEIRDAADISDRFLNTEKIELRELDSAGPHTFEALIDFSPTIHPVRRRTDDPVRVRVILEREEIVSEEIE